MTNTPDRLSLAAEVEQLLQRLRVPADRYTNGPLRARSPISGDVIAAVATTSSTEATAAIGRAHAAYLHVEETQRRCGHGHGARSHQSSVERVLNTMKLPPEEHLLVTAQNARITLDNGFTSAYSAGALAERFEVALRDMIG